MSTTADLLRKFRRASYDLEKSLVKLEEVQRHPEMLSNIAIAEVQKYLSDVRIVVGKIEQLDVLNGKDVDSTGCNSR